MKASGPSTRETTAPANARKDSREPSTSLPGFTKERPTHMTKVKRDSVISSTSAGPQDEDEGEGKGKDKDKDKDKDEVKVEAQPTFRQRWKFRLRQWFGQSWPYRFCQWVYHFAHALARTNWNDQRRFVDLILTLGVVALFIFGIYLVVEFVLAALPTAGAQLLRGDGDVPRLPATVSLTAALYTDPAQATCYFPVVDGTTEWLDGITPASRYETLPKAIPESMSVTPWLSGTRTYIPGVTSPTENSSGPINHAHRSYTSRGAESRPTDPMTVVAGEATGEGYRLRRVSGLDVVLC
jgi:hypothetical protein